MYQRVKHVERRGLISTLERNPTMKSSKSSDRRPQKNVFLLITVFLIVLTPLWPTKPSLTGQAKRIERNAARVNR